MGCCNANEKDKMISSAKVPKASKNPSKLFSASLSMDDFKKKYEFVSHIGKGGFGQVKLYRSHTNSKDYENFAVKILKKDSSKSSWLNALISEVTIHRTLSHKNIVKFHDTYEDSLFLYIVMEYIPGESLGKVVQKKKFNRKHFNEKSIVSQLVSTIIYLHSLGIVHRDIKAENILFAKPGKYNEIKLIDFGLSYQMASKELEDYLSKANLQGNPKSENLLRIGDNPLQNHKSTRRLNKTDNVYSHIKGNSISETKADRTEKSVDNEGISNQKQSKRGLSTSLLRSRPANIKKGGHRISVSPEKSLDGNEGNQSSNKYNLLKVENSESHGNCISNIVTPRDGSNRNKLQQFHSDVPSSDNRNKAIGENQDDEKKDGKIMFFNKDKDHFIVVEDSRAVNNSKHLIGSPYYMSPEMVQGYVYGPMTDVWSIGVLICYITTGQFPFNGDSMKELVWNINNINYNKSLFHSIKGGSEIKDLVDRIFIKDPTKRISLGEILSHFWFRRKSNTAEVSKTDLLVISNPSHRRQDRLFKREVILFLALMHFKANGKSPENADFVRISEEIAAVLEELNQGNDLECSDCHVSVDRFANLIGCLKAGCVVEAVRVFTLG